MTHWLIAFFVTAFGVATALFRKYYLPKEMASQDRDVMPVITNSTPLQPSVEAVVESSPQIQVNGWDTPRKAFHSTRVICDEIGLTFKQKEILCGCVFQESEFLVNPRPNPNKDPKTGKVWSTDYGIVQVNDHFHIGKGKDFESVEYVITHPEACIRWMAGIMKATGELEPWSSYVSGAYKQHLLPNSAMSALR